MTLKQHYEQLDYSAALESDAAAKAWLAAYDGQFGHFINGSFCDNENTDALVVTNPANGDTLATIGAGDDATVDQAVQAARAALPAWQAMGGMGRAKILYAIARQIQKQARLFAVLETLDNGKPIRESRDGDIPLVIRHFYHHAGWAKLQATEFADYDSVGVVGQIIPWNFPLLMLAWKIAPALAMGNTLVLKPAEQTPLTAMLFAEICQQAGVPDGVVNIINGAGATGAYLAAHTDVDKVAFTGSTEVGKSIRRATAGQNKKLSLELGGKSAFIVFEDADLDAAVEGLVDSIWFNQGEVCCAGSRLLVQASVESQLINKLKHRMQTLQKGQPLDKSTDMGSLVSQQQFLRVQGLVDAGLQAGGELFQTDDVDSDNNYYPPSLITQIESSHPLLETEIFGPVLLAMSFRTQTEAVALANNSRYGLAASIWSENINLALDAAPKLKAGVVWINCHNQFDAACGFGGVKESGFGREGGREGLFEYLKPKHCQQQTPMSMGTKQSNRPQSQATTTGIDHTLKFYIGGKQTRPDGGMSRPIMDAQGQLADWVGIANRKDIRNAVSAAQKAKAWSQAAGHTRAQILYYMAEHLYRDQQAWQQRLHSLTGVPLADAQTQLDTAIERLFTYAAWADKYDGQVHSAPYRGVTMALPEPKGVLGIVMPPHQPLISCISLLAAALCMGNRVVLVASEAYANLVLALVPLLETADIPAGVVNIVAGPNTELAVQLAGHAEIDGLWCWADRATIRQVEAASAEDLKPTWCHDEYDRNWLDDQQGQGQEFLRQGVEIKNIWTPYGD